MITSNLVAHRLEISAAIGVNADAPEIGEKRRGFGWKEFTRDADERWVQFDQVDALDSGMTERLRDGAAGSAADHENVARGGVLQQRVVHRLFSGAFVRRVGENKAIFIQAADVAGFDDRQVP